MAQGSVTVQIVNQVSPLAKLTEADLLAMLVERVKTANRRGTARSMCNLFTEAVQIEATCSQYRAHYNCLHIWIQEFEHDFLLALRRAMKLWVTENPFLMTEVVLQQKFYVPLNSCQTFLQAVEVYDRIRQEYIAEKPEARSPQQLTCYNLLADFFGEYTFCLNVNEVEQAAEVQRLEAEQQRLATTLTNNGLTMFLRMHGPMVAARMALSFMAAHVAGNESPGIAAIESGLQTVIRLTDRPGQRAEGGAGVLAVRAEGDPLVTDARS